MTMRVPLGMVTWLLAVAGVGSAACAVRTQAIRRVHPRAMVGLQSNIFEKVATGAASAIGKGLNKVTGLPELTDEEQAAMEKAMLDGTLNFDQFLVQMQVMSKAGSISQTLANVPGVDDNPALDPKAVQMAEEKLKRYEGFISAMDEAERAQPELLLPGGADAPMRVERLARAASASEEDIRQFLGEFVVMRKTSQAFAQRKSPEEVKAIMTEAQESAGTTNRRERRLAAKEARKGAKRKGGAGGFGAK